MNKNGYNMNEETLLETNKEQEVVTEPDVDVNSLEIKEETPPVFSPQDTAAQIFKHYYPMYTRLVNKLGKNSLMRLNQALVGYPLEDNIKPNPKNNDEKLAFYLADKLIQAKTLLIQYSLLEQQKELEEKKVDKNEVSDTVNLTLNEKGDNNG